MKEWWTDNKGHFRSTRPSYRKLATFRHGKQVGDGWVYVGWKTKKERIT